jgi:parallel beta-helix repeat protein
VSRLYRIGIVVALVIAAGVAVSGHFTSGVVVAQPPGETRLPGARPLIDAAKYASLQAAIDAIPAEGGVIRIPPGTFEITEPIVIRRSDVFIEGSGTATHIKNTNTSGKAAIIIESAAGAKAKAKDQIWRVQIANLRVTGNEKSGDGIHAMQVNEILLSGVTSSYHGGNGIVLDRCYEDPRVIGCLMTYNKKVGLNLPGCHDIVVSANQFEENQDALHCTDSFNLCMTGNCLDDHLGNGVVIENTYGSVLSGNMIEECNGIAVILDRDCYGITISSNVIAHNDGGVDLRDAHGCAVSANTFTINAKAGLRIGPGSGRITVTGNNFSNSYLGEGKVKRAPKDLLAAGLKLEGTSDIAITGNTFAGVRPKAVEADDTSRRVLFSDNVITDAASDHEKLKQSVIGPVLNGTQQK